MSKEDYYRKHGASQAIMRRLLEREGDLRGARFGLQRRDFLGGALGALAALAVVEQVPRFRSHAEAQEGFSPPSDDCYAQVAATQATFTHLAQASELDWQLLQQARAAQHPAQAETILNMLRTLGTLYGGFGVDQLTHCLQTATRAVRSNAPDEVVLIALLHDVGELVSGLSHSEIGAALVRPYVSNDSYSIVRYHTAFQLKHYGDAILKPTDLRDAYKDEPWYATATTFSDSWDQVAFDPAFPTLPLDEFEPLVRATFAHVPELQNRTAEECL